MKSKLIILIAFVAVVGLTSCNPTKTETADLKSWFNPTKTYGTMTDIDGNTYKTITIGTQTWMAENLKVTKYQNGKRIPNITDSIAWYSTLSSQTGAWCYYNNDATNNTK